MIAAKLAYVALVVSDVVLMHLVQRDEIWARVLTGTGAASTMAGRLG